MKTKIKIIIIIIIYSVKFNKWNLNKAIEGWTENQLNLPRWKIYNVCRVKIIFLIYIYILVKFLWNNFFWKRIKHVLSYVKWTEILFAYSLVQKYHCRQYFDPTYIQLYLYFITKDRKTIFDKFFNEVKYIKQIIIT